MNGNCHFDGDGDDDDDDADADDDNDATVPPLLLRFKYPFQFLSGQY